MGLVAQLDGACGFVPLRCPFESSRDPPHARNGTDAWRTYGALRS